MTTSANLQTSAFDPSRAPTQTDVERAWQSLVALGVTAIAGVPMADWNRALAVPNYTAMAPEAIVASDTARRTARIVVVLAAQLATEQSKQLLIQQARESVKSATARVAELEAQADLLSRENQTLERENRIHRDEILRLDLALAGLRAATSDWQATHVEPEVTP